MRRLLIAVIAGAWLLSSGCIVHVTHYRDRDGSLVYVGEVYNEGGPLIDATVSGTFYDAAGNVIATATGDVCQVLPSKGLVPFKVMLPKGTAEPARVEWKLDGEAVDDAYQAEGLTATIVHTMKDGQGFSWMSGEIRNTTSKTYYSGAVCAAWLNAAGDVVRVEWVTALGRAFGPGTALPFVLIEDIPPEAVDVRFALDAGVQVPGQPFPSVVTLPGSAFQHLFVKSFAEGEGVETIGVGEIHNTSTYKIRQASLITVVRDAGGKLVAAALDLNVCPVGVPPGGFTYGRYLLLAPTGSTQEPLRIEAGHFPSSEAVTLSPTGVKIASQAGALARVTGNVRNTGAAPLSSVTVCAGVYDDAGVVKGAYYTLPELPGGTLAPGASISFSFDVPNFGGAVSAKAIAEGFPE